MILEVIGLIVLVFINAYMYIAGFFLNVPTFSEPTAGERTTGVIIWIAAITLSYYIFTHLPFTVNWK